MARYSEDSQDESIKRGRPSSFKSDFNRNTGNERRSCSFKGEYHRNAGSGTNTAYNGGRRRWHSGKHRKNKCDNDIGNQRKNDDSRHIVSQDSTDAQSPLEERFLSHMPCMMIDREEEWDIGEMRPRVSSMPVKPFAQNSFRHKVLNLSPPMQETNIHRVRHFMIDSKGKVISRGEYIR